MTEDHAENLKIYFVLPSHCENDMESSEEMQQAFELCRQNQIQPEWIKENDCLTTSFDRKDIVVFEKFEGSAFQHVKTKLSIVGPYCILTCLMEGLQVPGGRSPIHNMAMHGLVITVSNYTLQQKKDMRTKIEQMGGTFSLHITSSVTHLISNSVRTQKYQVANERNIPVLLETWVDKVWNHFTEDTSNPKQMIHATNEKFLNDPEVKCPIFMNLKVCCTGLEFEERETLKKLVEKNGGNYSGRLIPQTTDILVCKLGIKSDKLNVARQAKIPCVKMDWIYDSIAKGYSLPEDNYLIRIAVVSTPTKSDELPFNPDFSTMSAISMSTTRNHDFTQSKAMPCSETVLYNETIKTLQNTEPSLTELLSQINLSQIKSSGSFLDGCGIQLYGWENCKSVRETICKILKIGGATRYDGPNSRVTHVLVHPQKYSQVKSTSAPLVSIHWLLESVRLKKPADEEKFLVSSNQSQPVEEGSQSKNNKVLTNSPLTKKGISFLQNETRIENKENFHEKEQQEEETITNFYKTSNTDTFENFLKNQSFSVAAIKQGFYSGKTFKIQLEQIEDDEEDELEEITSLVEEQGGKICLTYPVDYFIVSKQCSKQPIQKENFPEVITSFWLLDCKDKEKLLPIQYFHKPFNVNISKNGTQLPLLNLVITISGYSDYERAYLVELSEYMGATYQDKFARVELANKSVLASTHLICKEPQGSKFDAAVKWGRPVITHEWLLQCAKEWKLVSEDDYSLAPKKIQQIVENPQQKQSETNQVEEQLQKDLELNRTQQLMNTEPQIGVKRDIHGNKIMNSNKSTVSAESKTSNDCLLTLEDGRQVKFEEYMKDLKQQGLFDLPSPLPKDITSALKTGENYSPLKFNIEQKKVEKESPVQPTASQTTPVGSYLRGLQKRLVAASSRSPESNGPTPKKFKDNFNDSGCIGDNVRTPETPLGRFLGDENPSSSTRKHWKKYIDQIPQYTCHNRPPAANPGRASTPWDEIKRQAWKWLLREDEKTSSSPPLSVPATIPSSQTQENEETTAGQNTSGDATQMQEIEKPETPMQKQLREQFSKVQEMLGSGRKSHSSTSDEREKEEESESKESKWKINLESQPDTVGWDDDDDETPVTSSLSKKRIFMLSGLTAVQRTECESIINRLGGEVSNLKSYDPEADYVICATASRNEKILSSIAAGKWLLHYDYIVQCNVANEFLPCETFEFGTGSDTSTALTTAMKFWRLRVAETHNGAFAGMRAIVFAKNTDAIQRLITAGSGIVLNLKPPFLHDVDITHCFIDIKTISLNLDDFLPLVQQEIPVLNVLYLSNFLTSQAKADINDFILPYFKGHYE